MSTFLRVARMPWLAWVRSPTGWAFVLVWLLLINDVVRVLGIRGEASQFGVTVLMLALAFAWRMVADTLWLARDARALRVPGVGQDADAALALFALLTVAVPALLLGLVFGHPLDWLVSLALVAVCTLGACILPLLPVLCVFLLLVGVVILAGDAPPGPGDPAFLAWAVPTLIALAVMVLHRWTVLRRTGVSAASRWFRPALSNPRMLTLRRLHGGALSTPDETGASTPRKSPASTLNRVGPAFPVRSIRAALGGGMLPFDLAIPQMAWRRRQLLLVVLVLLPSAFAMLALRLLGSTTLAGWSPQLLLMPGVAVIALMMQSLRELDLRWSSRCGELALLALLPRLAADACRDRVVLVACCARQVATCFCFGAMFALVFVVLHVPAVFYVLLGLILLCAALAEAAMAAKLLGGEALRGWRMRVPGWSMMLPLVASMLSVDPTVARPGSAWLSWPEAGAVALWVLWCAVFAAVFARCWRALKRRPHPFLAGAR